MVVVVVVVVVLVLVVLVLLVLLWGVYTSEGWGGGWGGRPGRVHPDPRRDRCTPGRGGLCLQKNTTN